MTSLRCYGIGVKPQTENDIPRLSKLLRIPILWTPGDFAFTYAIPDSIGRSFIGLPAKAKGIDLQFKAFHEFGHILSGHVGDEPEILWYDKLSRDKREIEADAVALIALMPVGSDWQDIRTSRFGVRLYNERLRLYFTYGI